MSMQSYIYFYIYIYKRRILEEDYEDVEIGIRLNICFFS